MASQMKAAPVPEEDRRPLPAYARAWGKDVDYPAPGLITEELQQNIHIDSIFVKSGELIIPDKCEECRARAKGCDRRRPVCGRCDKIGKKCYPVSESFTRLRKGRGGKALPIRVWGQSEDPEKIDYEREEAERRERERLERELKAREIVTTGKKRKRAESYLINTVHTPSLPPSKGHYVDYTSANSSWAELHATCVSFPIPTSQPPRSNPQDIPIDPVLLELSSTPSTPPISLEPPQKRAHTLSSPVKPSWDSTLSRKPSMVTPLFTRTPGSFTSAPITPLSFNGGSKDDTAHSADEDDKDTSASTPISTQNRALSPDLAPPISSIDETTFSDPSPSPEDPTGRLAVSVS